MSLFQQAGEVGKWKGLLRLQVTCEKQDIDRLSLEQIGIPDRVKTPTHNWVNLSLSLVSDALAVSHQKSCRALKECVQTAPALPKQRIGRRSRLRRLSSDRRLLCTVDLQLN